VARGVLAVIDACTPRDHGAFLVLDTGAAAGPARSLP
jgi:hypothetical protein